MKNVEQYNKARAAIAGVNLARLGCVAIGVYYGVKLDWGGVVVMAACFWIVGLFLPVTDK